MGQNLTGQTIASTYEDLVQISGSILTDGTGSDITNISITASNAVSASYAFTASFALNAGTTVDTGSLLVTASISDATTTYTKGDGSTFALTVNNVQNASTASIATTASFATSASYAVTASYAETANLGTAATASFIGSTWTFNHNLGKDYVIIDCYDSNNEEIIPSTIDLVTANQASITFPVSVTGTAVASLGSGTAQNQVTQSFATYNGFSPINSVSTQVGSFQTGYTQKLTITSTGTYNLHVSASGPHWVDFTGLASGTTANLNIYMWVDSFNALPANSGSMIMFNAAAGTGNYVTYRTIVTGSGVYWVTNTVVGNTSTSVARNATLARRDFQNAAGNPTAIIKTVDGDVILYNPGSPLQTTQYTFTGNQGTPIP